jgi:limonene-1,2-epoxide hydrolase
MEPRELVRALVEAFNRGCGFFHVADDKIAFQRGYWDKMTFLRTQGLPMP